MPTSQGRTPAVAPSGIPCRFEGCPDDAQEGGYCWGHAKQKRLGKPLTAKRDDSRTPWELVADAIHRYVDADEDAEYKLAKDNLRKVILSWAGKHRPSGRPPKYQAEELRRVVEETGSINKAAKALGIPRWTLQRYLRRMGYKPGQVPGASEDF